MKVKRSIWVALLVSMIFLSVFVILGTANNKEPVDYVNPFIGTGKFIGPSQWGAYAGTYPGAVVPFGMIQLTPETRETGEPRGYYYEDKKIRYFSLVDHKSGYPSGSSGYICVMPITGDITEIKKDYSSSFSHDKETAFPGYYAVILEDYNIKAEFTATERAGFCKFAFPKSGNSNILLLDVSEEYIQSVNNRHIVGQKGKFYFAIEFSKPFNLYRTFENGVFVQYCTSENEVILAKVGISSVSTDGARKNLKAEIPDWDFDRVRTEAEESWNKMLKRIEIEGPTEDQKVIFYTALYHTLLLPYIFTDVNGEYKGLDGKVHIAEDYTYYYGFSPWDTFRSQHPLLTLLEPAKERDMIRSLIDMYEQSGRLPTGPMTGNHAIPIIVDSYVKGITDFDFNKAYEAMRKSIMEPPFGRRDIAVYLELGYVPAEQNDSATKTLEYAYDDWALAQFAKTFEREEDYNTLMKRAYYYRNVFDLSTRFMSAKTKEGAWTIGGFIEGNTWVYSWFVPHDPQGLINLMGGYEAFNTRLEECFDKNHYMHDNEPLLHYAYLFSYARVPYRTQKWVREIMATSYAVGPGGLPGNDDLGALSSWYVFSAMGFYPVCPGRSMYVIGSPIFDKVTIHLPEYWGGKDFVIIAKNNSKKDKYVQSATLNSQPLNRSWNTHSEIVNGGTLVFEMGSEPNKEWGSAAGDAPLSMTKGSPDFEYSGFELSSTVVNVGEPFTVSAGIKNVGDALGTAVVSLYIDGDLAQTEGIILSPGKESEVGITTTLYEIGEHEVAIASMEPKTVTVEAVEPLF